MVRDGARRRRRSRGGHRHGERVRRARRRGLAHAAGGAWSSRGWLGCALRRSPASSGTASRSCAAPDADALLDEIGATVRGWAVVLHERGVAALLEAVTTDTALPGRLLARSDGERWLTDLRHVGPGAARGRRRRAPRPGALWSSGCAAASTRPGSTWAPNAADGWSPMRRRCRSSPSTGARGWSSRSSTYRSGGTATSAIPEVPLFHEGPGPRARCRRGERRGLAGALRRPPRRGGGRGSPAASTWR